jgi:hypothetical protein
MSDVKTQLKVLLGDEHSEWLDDLAVRLNMTKSDVLRDLILDAHVRLERGELQADYSEYYARRALQPRAVA